MNTNASPNPDNPNNDINNNKGLPGTNPAKLNFLTL